jgi:hypothetical protein
MCSQNNGQGERPIHSRVLDPLGTLPSHLKRAEFYSDSSTHAILCCVAGDLFQKFNFLRSLFTYEFAFYAAWAEKVSSKFSVLKTNFVMNHCSYGLLLLGCYKLQGSVGH